MLVQLGGSTGNVQSLDGWAVLDDLLRSQMKVVEVGMLRSENEFNVSDDSSKLQKRARVYLRVRTLRLSA